MRAIQDDGDKTRSEVAEVGGDLAERMRSVAATQEALGVEMGNVAAAQQRAEGEAKLEKLAANKKKLEEQMAALEAAEEALMAETADKEAVAKAQAEAKAQADAMRQTLVAVGDELLAVKDLAGTAAEAALTGAEAMKATIEKLEETSKELMRSIPEQVEAGLVVAMMRKENVDKFISLDDESGLKASVEQMKIELKVLAQQQSNPAAAAAPAAGARPSARPAARPAAAPAAPAARPTTRGGGARAAAAQQPVVRSSKKPVRAPPEPKRVLKGEIGEEMKRYTATLLGEKGNKAGAYEAKVKALAAVSK